MTNQRRDAVDNALWVGEPVKDIPHIPRDPANPNTNPKRHFQRLT